MTYPTERTDMDGLTFAAEIVKAAAWPALGVAAVLLFRRELASLLSQLKRGKVAGAEFEFERSLMELPASGHAPPSDAYTIRLQNPARNAIADSWSALECSARDLLQSRGIPQSVLPRRASGLARALGELDLLDQEQIGLFLHLRELSIRAAVDPEAEPSAEAAARFVQTAERLRETLEMPIVQA